jgi:UDP-glucose:(heptosyl)LPS alpha-1,3-glucosyltransferase
MSATMAPQLSSCRRMKIAFIVHDYHRAGGHSRYVAELASRFASEHEVHVFANRIDRDGTTGIHFHTVPAWRANALTTVLTFAVPATVQPGRGFDIIHSQGFCGFRGNVWTGHICNRAWHLALQNREGGATFRESIFNAVASALEHAVYRCVRRGAVVAISQRVARDIARYYHCPAPIHVIHHGVDLQLFSPSNRLTWRSQVRKQYGLADGETVFLYVGDMRKGGGRCIQALSKLAHGRLLFVSRSLEGPYRRMADDLGLAGRVMFLGPTNQVERIYAAADALMLPTPYDAFAMVVSEAMASGLPVVVSREAGASELIQHGVNGLLLDDLTNVTELAGHMDSLSRDPRWAAGLGRAARKTVEPMSWDAVARQTMRVYEGLLNWKPQTPVERGHSFHGS